MKVLMSPPASWAIGLTEDKAPPARPLPQHKGWSHEHVIKTCAPREECSLNLSISKALGLLQIFFLWEYESIYVSLGYKCRSLEGFINFSIYHVQ